MKYVITERQYNIIKEIEREASLSFRFIRIEKMYPKKAAIPSHDMLVNNPAISKTKKSFFTVGEFFRSNPTNRKVPETANTS